MPIYLLQTTVLPGHQHGKSCLSLKLKPARRVPPAVPFFSVWLPESVSQLHHHHPSPHNRQSKLSVRASVIFKAASAELALANSINVHQSDLSCAHRWARAALIRRQRQQPGIVSFRSACDRQADNNHRLFTIRWLSRTDEYFKSSGPFYHQQRQPASNGAIQ